MRNADGLSDFCITFITIQVIFPQSKMNVEGFGHI